MPGLKLFHTANSGMTEVVPRLADVEADVQGLIEAHMETMLGVRFLASEYVIDCVDGGRIDSLRIDENGAPVIVEIRAVAMSVATAFNWLANWAVTESFPRMADWNLSATYACYAAFALLSGVFVLRVVKETKGRQLEDTTAGRRAEKSSQAIRGPEDTRIGSPRGASTHHRTACRKLLFRQPVCSLIPNAVCQAAHRSRGLTYGIRNQRRELSFFPT